MQPPKEAIDELKQLFREHYGVEMSNEDAQESARNLLNFTKLLLDLDDKQKRA
jgi:hypothetical protein